MYNEIRHTYDNPINYIYIIIIIVHISVVYKINHLLDQNSVNGYLAHFFNSTLHNISFIPSPFARIKLEIKYVY